MTQKEIEQVKDELDNLYNEIPEGTGLLEVVYDIVRLELLLEAECGQ